MARNPLDGNSLNSDSLDDNGHKVLVAQAAEGDAAAVRQLMERYLPRVRALVRLNMDDALRAKESCSDLVQEICIELLRRQDDLEYRGEAEFRSWLFQAALNKVRERRRYWLSMKRDARRELEARSSASWTSLSGFYMSLSTPSRKLMADEHMAALEHAFQQLPEHYRQVIIQARIVGLPHEQVAEQIGKSVGATRQILGRALLRLSDLMTEGSSDGGS